MNRGSGDPPAPYKGRGAISNPEGRFESRRVEPVDDGWGQDPAAELPPLETTVSPEAARRIISRNNSPDVPFDQSINPYRGCEHGCVYCLAGETPVLMGNGSFKPLGDLRAGDEVYGTQRQGHYRRYVRTPVLDHWQSRKPAYRVSLADGTELVASADHRFLTERGWKFVAGDGRHQRPHLTLNNTLMGFGAVATSTPRCDTSEYRLADQAVKSRADLSVVAIERLSAERDLFDITTGTGDFIANGVVSHNCFARPTHSYVNLSPGLDFETKLFYKERAAELLDRELRRPGYLCTPINVGASTDPYQPIERRLKVTRSILEVLQRFRHPLTIVTKSQLVERDLDILTDLARDDLVAVYVSVTTLDARLKRTLEPRAPSPAARLQAVRRLRQAGVPVGVLVAPLIPAVTDAELERILEACAEAGAQSVGYVLLRLPWEVKDLFKEWLDAHMPLRARHVMSLIHAMRNGKDNDPRYGTRMRGEGPYAELIERRFDTACRRFGLSRKREIRLSTDHFRVPPPSTGQLSLL